MKADSSLILWLLEESGVTKYGISKATGIHITTLTNLTDGTSHIVNLSFKNAAALTEYAEKIKGEKAMRTLEMNYDNNPASWWEIWNTSAKTLKEAWREMDEQPTELGWIRFQDGDGVTMRANNEE